MTVKQELHLTEKFVLLGLYASDRGLEYTYEIYKEDCCIGATLLELLYDGLIHINAKNRVEIVNDKTNRDDYAKKMLTKISAVKEKKSLKGWSNFFIDKKDDGIPEKQKPLLKDIYEDIVSGLVKKEIAEAKKESFLFIDITNYKVSKEAIDSILQRMHRELFNTKPPTMEVISLFVLLKKASLLDEFLSKYEQRKFKEGLKKWAEESETFKSWIIWTMAALNEGKSKDKDDEDDISFIGPTDDDEDVDGGDDEGLIEGILSFFE